MSLAAASRYVQHLFAVKLRRQLATGVNPQNSVAINIPSRVSSVAMTDRGIKYISIVGPGNAPLLSRLGVWRLPL